MRRAIAGLLVTVAPALDQDKAWAMATALLQTLKGVRALANELEGERRAAALAGVRAMVRLYVVTAFENPAA